MSLSTSPPRAVHSVQTVRVPTRPVIEVDWQPPEKRRRRNAAICVMCGLAAGNSLNTKVLRYPLLRRVNPPGKRQTSVCIGSIGLCDRCVIETADLNERAKIRQSEGTHGRRRTQGQVVTASAGGPDRTPAR